MWINCVNWKPLSLSLSLSLSVLHNYLKKKKNTTELNFDIVSLLKIFMHINLWVKSQLEACLPICALAKICSLLLWYSVKNACSYFCANGNRWRHSLTVRIVMCVFNGKVGKTRYTVNLSWHCKHYLLRNEKVLVLNSIKPRRITIALTVERTSNGSKNINKNICNK